MITTLRRNAYVVLLLSLGVIGGLGLITPFLAVLFSFFVLEQLNFLRRAWLTVVVFIILVSVVGVGLAYFIDEAVRTLPRVANTAIPGILQYAEEHGLRLPFTDWASLKAFVLESVGNELGVLGKFARRATKQFVFMLIGLVVATSLFLGSSARRRRGPASAPTHLYGLFCVEMAERFRLLYHAFETVMGAQLVISAINTGATAVFTLWVGLPYPGLLLALTFLCGLLPIVGNLMSNSVIVGVAFTVSPHLALWALVFLIGLHKLEYFLNSKIIGERIKNPVWATLIALIVGDMLIGIPGMILAPVILYYLRLELSQVPLPAPEPPRAAGPAPPPPT